VQYWFKPIIATYFYGGLRKHEAAYNRELKYSGLKGENLIYEKGKLSYIYLPPTKGRKECQIPVIKDLREYLEGYLKERGKVGEKDFVFIYQGDQQKAILFAEIVFTLNLSVMLSWPEYPQLVAYME